MGLLQRFENADFPQRLAMGVLSKAGERGITLEELAAEMECDREEAREALEWWGEGSVGVRKDGSGTDARYRPGSPPSEDETIALLQWTAGYWQSAGKLNRALADYFQLLMKHQERGERFAQAADLGNIGTVFLRAGEFAKARETFGQALSLHIELGDRLGRGLDLANLGVSEARMGNVAKARELLSEARLLFREAGREDLDERTQKNMESLDKSDS